MKVYAVVEHLVSGIDEFGDKHCDSETIAILSNIEKALEYVKDYEPAIAFIKNDQFYENPKDRIYRSFTGKNTLGQSLYFAYEIKEWEVL